MAKDLAAAFPAARAVFDTVDAALGVPLSTLAFDGPAEELTLTHNAQPALLAHGAAVWAVVRERVALKVVAAAGHSLGEFTAYHAAGAIGLADAATLVRRRGQLMYDTGVQRPGAMAAILGDTTTPIEAICATAAAQAGPVVAANYNSPGQVVISGEVAGVEKAMELAKAAGARKAIRLAVSGAFHSPLMAPAVDGLRDALVAANVGDAAFPVVANVDAEPKARAAEIRDGLLRQLTAPVQWSSVMGRLATSWPDALFVELGPGSVLGGLAKKIAPNVAVMSCGTVADVEQLLAKVA